MTDRSPVKMGIFHLLSILVKTFCKILSLCSMAWNPFFWYKITWPFILQFSQEISSALTFGQDQTSEESKDTDTQPFLQNDEPDPDEEELGKELKQTQDVNSTPMSRLYAFEEKVGKLESDLSGEKQLWRTRYQELRIEQQALKEQERCILPDSKKVEDPMHVSDDTDGAAESDINVEDGLRRRLGDANAGKTCTHACKNLTTDGYNSLDLPSLFSCCPSMQSFSFYYPSSTTGLKNHKCFRVFAPRSPLDLKIGSRVKVILPCGKVGTGSVCQLGQLPGKGEFQVGVDLESPYCQQRSFFRPNHITSMTIGPNHKVDPNTIITLISSEKTLGETSSSLLTIDAETSGAKFHYNDHTTSSI
ncbi:uncharacterized protein PAF06_004602 [Gastrophryne carolinensis]